MMLEFAVLLVLLLALTLVAGWGFLSLLGLALVERDHKRWLSVSELSAVPFSLRAPPMTRLAERLVEEGFGELGCLVETAGFMRVPVRVFFRASDHTYASFSGLFFVPYTTFVTQMGDGVLVKTTNGSSRHDGSPRLQVAFSQGSVESMAAEHASRVCELSALHGPPASGEDGGTLKDNLRIARLENDLHFGTSAWTWPKNAPLELPPSSLGVWSEFHRVVIAVGRRRTSFIRGLFLPALILLAWMVGFINTWMFFIALGVHGVAVEALYRLRRQLVLHVSNEGLFVVRRFQRPLFIQHSSLLGVEIASGNLVLHVQTDRGTRRVGLNGYGSPVELRWVARVIEQYRTAALAEPEFGGAMAEIPVAISAMLRKADRVRNHV
jgi:hypothetical protein